MIVRSRPRFRDILFAVRGSILPRIWLHLVSIALVSVFAVLAAWEHPGIFARMSAIPFTLVGIALSVFMSFRNSACYDRWWEGRKLLGDMVITCRSIARQVSTLDNADKIIILHGLCGFSAGLVAHLRNEDERQAIKSWCDVGSASHAPNPTNAVLDYVGRHCLLLMNENKINPIHYSVIEEQLSKLSNVQGGCERIASTPVPYAYSLLLHRTALIFCVTLPFALAGSLNWWTLLPVLLVAYTFFGLDALGHELEGPFGLEPNALPLNALRRTVEREMLASLGLKDIPPLIEPQGNVLT
ncbi:MAG: bestrophin family protein [Proteobacteria bacterium]|nr:bestrophin family protein [Pseudomonadota bacterium]MBS0268953.1 bestrophin family protein [Pseudomonadota bacterium]